MSRQWGIFDNATPPNFPRYCPNTCHRLIFSNFPRVVANRVASFFVFDGFHVYEKTSFRRNGTIQYPSNRYCQLTFHHTLFGIHIKQSSGRQRSGGRTSIIQNCIWFGQSRKKLNDIWVVVPWLAPWYQIPIDVVQAFPRDYYFWDSVLFGEIDSGL